MIENLVKEINNENYNIINDLVFTITDEKIKSIEELKESQDKNFIINGKSLSDEERITHCINTIKNYPYDYDFLDFNEIQVYKQLMGDLEINISNEDKIKNLIILYSLTKKEMVFPYYAYNMIINNKI